MNGKQKSPPLKLKSFENWSMAIDYAFATKLELKRSSRETLPLQQNEDFVRKSDMEKCFEYILAHLNVQPIRFNRYTP